MIYALIALCLTNVFSIFYVLKIKKQLRDENKISQWLPVQDALEKTGKCTIKIIKVSDSDMFVWTQV